MATYSQELDGALLPVPWLIKSGTNDTTLKSYLMKYAPHPSKPGYVLLLTDLRKVYFEPLAGIRLLARQREVEEKYGQSQRQDGGGSSLDVGGEEAVQEVLDNVAGLLGTELEGAELEISPGDLYDLDVTIKSDDTTWIFHMTEIRFGCLEIITRHMIHPLALSISSSRRPTDSTDDQITELVSSTKVLEAVNRHSSHKAPEPRKPASPQKKGKSKLDEPVEKTESTTGKGRLVRRRQGTSRTASPGPAIATEDSVVKSPSPTLHNHTSSSPRKGKGKRQPQISENEDEDEEMMPEEASSPVAEPSASRQTRTRQQTTSPVPVPPRPPRPRKQKETSQEESDEEMADPGKSPTPPPPSAPSQKTQQEKDEDEEQALAKKREEMKRRMGAGGGGRLVRRRFG